MCIFQKKNHIFSRCAKLIFFHSSVKLPKNVSVLFRYDETFFMILKLRWDNNSENKIYIFTTQINYFK